MDKRRAALIRRYIDYAFRHPLRLLALVAAVFAGSTWLASQIAFRSSFLELLPDDAPEVKDLQMVSARAGGDGYVVIAVDARDPEAAKQYAAALAPEVEKLPDVHYVEYRYDVEFFSHRALLLLPLDQLKDLRLMVKERLDYEKAGATGLLVEGLIEPPPSWEEIERHFASKDAIPEHLVSNDGKYLYLFAKPKGVAADLAFCRRLIDSVTRAADQVIARFPGMAKPRLSGLYVLRIEEDAVMRRDVTRASILALILAIIVILVATRRPTALALVMVPVVVGIAATFAVAYLAIGYVTIVTGFLFAVLIGLGIEYGVHLSMRYWEERRDEPDREALYLAVRGTVAGATTSAATNAAAFAVLVFARFQAFRQFGFIAALGIVLTLLGAYLIAPPIIAIAERIRPFKAKARPPPDPAHPMDHTPVPIRRLLPTRVLLGLTAAMLLFGLYSAYSFRPAFDTDTRSLSRSEVLEFDSYVSRSLGQDIVPAIVWVRGPEEAAKVDRYVRDVIKARGESNLIVRVASINDLVPHDQDARMEEVRKLKRMFDRAPAGLLQGADAEKIRRAREMVSVKPFTVDEIPVSVRRRLTALDGNGTFVLLFPQPGGLYDTQQTENWAAQIDDVLTMARAAGVEAAALHEARIAARIFQLVRQDGPLILAGAAIAVLVMLFIDLRSLRRALLVMGPLAIGFASLGAAMKLFGLKLNVLNVAVLPNLVAIAVDNAVHIYHRYQEEGPGSLAHVIRHTGLAAIVATFANASGYAALLVAQHHGLKTVGTIALLGVTCTSIGTTVFFPAVLALGERWELYRALRGLKKPEPAGDLTPPAPGHLTPRPPSLKGRGRS